MNLCLILLIVSVQLAVQVQAIKTPCFSIYSEDNNELESLTWAVGVPNITVVIASNTSLYRIYYYRLYFKKSGKTTKFVTAFYDGSIKNDNATLANVSINAINEKMFNLTVTFLRPDLIDGQNISAHLSCCCDSETKAPIQLKYCPIPEDIVRSDLLLNTKFQYNEQASVQCNNTVFIDNVNDVIGRNFNITCGARAKWIGQRPKCWNGLFLDLTKDDPVQTFKQGVKVLMYCDFINPTMTKVAILGSEKVYSNGTKMAWAYVYFSNADNNRNVTCYQSSVTSQQSYQRSIKLNILYPPIVNGPYMRSITLHKDVYVEINFESNPPVSGLNAVTVTKHGKNVENFYKKYEDNLNKVVLHFINASLSDLGEYNVKIESGPPFHTNKQFLVRVSARTTNPPAISTRLYRATSAVPPPQTNTSVPLSSLLLVTILLIISLVILIIGAMKYFRVLCFKGKPIPDEPSVRFNNDLPGECENVGNYEVPKVGNPYQPDSRQGFRPQRNNYQNTPVGYPQEEESAYDSI